MYTLKNTYKLKVNKMNVQEKINQCMLTVKSLKMIINSSYGNPPKPLVDEVTYQSLMRDINRLLNKVENLKNSQQENV